MPIESATYISDLDSSNPLGVDGKSGGDNHLRMLKATAKNTFPGASKAFRFPVSVAEKTANFSITFPDDQNRLFICDSTAGTIAASLPDPTSGGTVNEDGFDLWFVRRTGTNNVTITPSGAQTINGAASLVLRDNQQWAYLRWAKVPAKWIAFGAGPNAYPPNLASELTSPASGDIMPIQDISDSNIVKYITLLNMLKVLADLTEETVIALDDVMLLYDLSATAVRKMLPANFLNVLNLLTEDTAPAQADDFALVYDTSASTVKKVKLRNLAVGALIAVIEDQKSSGTAADLLTASSTVTRTLNTLAYNRDTLVSLASDRFTLPAGTWEISWEASFGFSTSHGDCTHQSLLYNQSDSSEVARGMSASVDRNADESGELFSSTGCTVVTIASSKNFEIRHQVSAVSAGGVPRQGLPSSFSTEVYTRVIVRKA